MGKVLHNITREPVAACCKAKAGKRVFPPAGPLIKAQGQSTMENAQSKPWSKSY